MTAPTHPDIAAFLTAQLDREQSIAEAAKNGADLIALERSRQISHEGYRPEDDQQYTKRELVRAARAYLDAPSTVGLLSQKYTAASFVDWPWGDSSFKPTRDDRVRELMKAGALIAAEIDRIQVTPTLAQQDPKKVLADIASKRAVVKMWTDAEDAYAKTRTVCREDVANALTFVVFALAAPFADQPGYRPEWAVET